MKQASATIDHRLVKALAHPLRMRILTLLDLKVASPSDLAEELGEPLGNVSYHVRFLANLGCLELVKTTPRRGAVEHHYRAIMRPWFRPKDWAEIPRSARGSISNAVLAQIWKDAAAAVEAGTFESRPDRHVSRTPLVLDDAGWEEVVDLLNETLDRILEIQAEAAGRMEDVEDQQSSTCSQVVLMHYESAVERPARRRPSRRAKR